MLITVVAFIVILSILIFVHEFGHFVVAKKTGIKVEEFGFGFPPRIWGKKIGETIYSINALPIGGFVKLLGEELEEQVGERPEINIKLVWDKIFVNIGFSKEVLDKNKDIETTIRDFIIDFYPVFSMENIDIELKEKEAE